MGRYRVMDKGPKPYALSNGDVVLAQPGKLLIIPDECDKSSSVMLAVKKSVGGLLKLEDEEKKDKTKAEKLKESKEEKKELEAKPAPVLTGKQVVAKKLAGFSSKTEAKPSKEKTHSEQKDEAKAEEKSDESKK